MLKSKENFFLSQSPIATFKRRKFEFFDSKSCQVNLPPSQVSPSKKHTPSAKVDHYIKAAWPHSSNTNSNSLKKTSSKHPSEDQEGWK